MGYAYLGGCPYCQQCFEIVLVVTDPNLAALLAVLPGMIRDHVPDLAPDENILPKEMKGPQIHCDLWDDQAEKREAFVAALQQHLLFWQSTQKKTELAAILRRAPVLHTNAAHNLRLHLYSAGRLHVARGQEPWHTEILSNTTLFRGDVEHDAHVNITPIRHHVQYHANGRIHNMSGLNPHVQREVVHDLRFTECLALLHERLTRATAEALANGHTDVHFVVTCNVGVRQSVAMVQIMQCLLHRHGWQNIEVEHLHLWGCRDPYVTNACCYCDDCWWVKGIAAETLSLASQQWRAVCC